MRSLAGGAWKRVAIAAAGFASILGLVVAVYAVYVFVLSRKIPPGTPSAVHLTRAELAGSWVGPYGGTLLIASDGTFVANDVCSPSVTVIPPGSVVGRWQEEAVGSNLFGAHAERTGGVWFSGIRSSFDMDEGKSMGRAVLWVYVLPWEDNKFCMLKKR